MTGKHNETGSVVQRKIEAPSFNHCCSGKAMSITQPDCECVALGNQDTMHMRHIVHLWPAPFFNVFPHYLIKGTI